MMPFGINCPTQVRFGAGVSAELRAVLPPNAKRVVLLRGAGTQACAPVRDLLRDMDVIELSAGGEPSVPSVNALIDQVSGPVDAVVACGGGAVIDTGKALAFCLNNALTLSDDFSLLEPDILAQPGTIPLLVLPTTAGTGAEVTSNAVLDVPSKRAKISLRGRALFPQIALVDPTLMLSAPKSVILNAGLDAVTQIIEAQTSNAANRFSDAMTGASLQQGLFALRRVTEDCSLPAMTDMAWTALASGLALANGGLGAAHGLASVIGGQYPAPHGALCGLFLPHVLRQNLIRAEIGSEAHLRIDASCAAVAEVFLPVGGGDDLSGLERWCLLQGLTRLNAYGVTADAVDGLAEQSLFASSSRKNAVALGKGDFTDILSASL